MGEVGNLDRAKWWRSAARLAAVAAVAWATAGAGAGVARAADAAASGPAPDKSGFTLFNPTPRESMRELSPDRPDVTESPYTVDAGHVQVEFSFAEWGKGSGVEETNVLPFIAKVGLTNSADLQFGFGPYNRLRAGGRTDEGASDATVRLKVNLFGNDGGDVAFGVMPFVSFPVGANAFTADAAEGGVILPLAVNLPAGFDLTTMAEFDFVRDGSGGRDTLLLHTASLGHDLTDKLGMYVEYAGIVDLDGDQKYEAYADVGLTYKVTDDVQLDAGVNVGLTAAAEDLRVFAGMTVRL
jgi:hypothetical protein